MEFFTVKWQHLVYATVTVIDSDCAIYGMQQVEHVSSESDCYYFWVFRPELSQTQENLHVGMSQRSNWPVSKRTSNSQYLAQHDKWPVTGAGAATVLVLCQSTMYKQGCRRQRPSEWSGGTL